ncbi:MAG: CPBP family intramembrane metalloprotease [Candidatus Latescibacteria bacterium]|nr:CPBP family intramembrane metalloprotease [Candidatus Latescibacterota bacterium]
MTEAKTKFHETRAGVFLISFALMVIAGLENSVAPWAPFYVVYAALATWLPIKWGTYRFGSIKAVPWWWWVISPIIAILAQAILSLLLNGVYARIVVAMGGVERLDDPLIAVLPMFNAMFAAASEHLGVEVGVVSTAYFAFIVAWAGAGEELYFRGYVQGTLRKRHSARYSILVAASLFAVRHYMQMLLMLPKYPIFAASAWVLTGFLFGILLGYLYERTKSLWVPIAIHYVFNIIPFLVG